MVNLGRVRNPKLRILNVEFPLRDEPSEVGLPSTFHYDPVQCTLIMTQILKKCRSLQRIQLLDSLEERDPWEDCMLVMIRGGPAPFVQKFDPGVFFRI